jgi:hypothetical protein
VRWEKGEVWKLRLENGKQQGPGNIVKLCVRESEKEREREREKERERGVT